MIRSNFSIYSLLNQFFHKKEQIRKVKAGTVLFQEKDPVEYLSISKWNRNSWESHMRGKDFILKILNS